MIRYLLIATLAATSTLLINNDAKACGVNDVMCMIGDVNDFARNQVDWANRENARTQAIINQLQFRCQQLGDLQACNQVLKMYHPGS